MLMPPLFSLAPFLRFRRRFGLLLALLLAASAAAAAPYTLGNTEVQALPRSANGRDYTLYLGLPSSYATSPARRYPVVYACDGYWDFHLLMAETGNLLADGAIPECIVVGFSYTGDHPDYGALRQWDYTPGYDPYAGANSGHAQEFLGVVANQFISYVESHYRADPAFRVLAGSSYGGLFAMYAMFERPGLFQAYIAASPALWWRSYYIASREREYAGTHRSLPARVYLTFAGDETSAIRESTRSFAEQLRRSHYSDLALAVREIAGERHSGTKPDAYNRGLRFAFVPLAPRPPVVADPGFGSPSTLVNLSTRGRVGRGDDVMIAGLVIRGLQPKRLLIRAVGPMLAEAEVAGYLGDPAFRVVDASHRTVAENDNWNDADDASSLATISRQVGAVPFPQGSRDAATVVTLDPGLYTVVVEGVDGAEGVALVEAYEIAP